MSLTKPHRKKPHTVRSGDRPPIIYTHPVLWHIAQFRSNSRHVKCMIRLLPLVRFGVM